MEQIIMLNDDCNPARQDYAATYNKDKFNVAYSHFINEGKKKGLDIVIAHFSDFDNGVIKAGWKFGDRWELTGDLPVNFVYDKFPANTDESKEIKEDILKLGIGVLNNPELEENFKDKMKNYLLFPDIIPRTVPVENSVDSIIEGIEELRSTPLPDDLSTDTVVLKPRRGHGGKGILFVEGENYKDLKNIPEGDYVVQPYLETNSGIPELGVTGRHDYRVVMVNGVPKISYARLPFGDERRSNVDLDGKIVHFNTDLIPSNCLSKLNSADKRLLNFMPRIYSFDFGFGRSGQVYGFENNGKPSQVWNLEDKKDEAAKKLLQDAILDALAEGVYKYKP